MKYRELISKEFIWVLLISVPGALLAESFNIPLAWFLGPMLFTSLASLLGLQLKMPRIILSLILILLGLYIGNYIDKDLFSQIHQWVWTSFIMLIYIIFSVLFVSRYLQKFSKYEKKTSIFSAAPGALGPLLILAEDEKSDLSHVATSHLIRLIIIITVFPFIVSSFYDSKNIEISKVVIENQNLIDLFILLITSITLIYFFNKLKVPAALLSGTLIASGFLQITELASYKIPTNIIDYCLLILGASVGCRFANKTFAEIGKNALHSFVATFFLVIFGVIAAYVASLIIDKNFFTLLLSYCPGGIYEVAVIAIFFDLDPEFVSFHHIIRLLMILFIVPIILRLIEKKT
mgnify:CR=1 FL=1